MSMMETLQDAAEEAAEDDSDDGLAAKLADATERAHTMCPDDNVCQDMPCLHDMQRLEGKVDMMLLIMQQLSSAVSSSPLARFLGK